MVETGAFRVIARFLRDGGLFRTPDARTQEVLLALVRRIAGGDPVPVEWLARNAGLDAGDVRGLLGCMPPTSLEYDDAGRIVGVQGLSLLPTRHRFAIAGRDLYTWCAFDCMFLPGILGETARITSPCPVTGSDIRLTLAPERVVTADPADAVMSFVVPRAAGYRADLRRTFCRHVHFLASPRAGADWLARNPGAAILSLEEAHALGRIRNQTGFRDTLAA